MAATASKRAVEDVGPYAERFWDLAATAFLGTLLKKCSKPPKTSKRKRDYKGRRPLRDVKDYDRTKRDSKSADRKRLLNYSCLKFLRFLLFKEGTKHPPFACGRQVASPTVEKYFV